MRNKQKEPLKLVGRGVVLEEIRPEYFEPVIRWRNDPGLNHFLNQPESLTMEMETSWYENCYLPDDTQGFLVMVDKKSGVPFGTIGWTDMDIQRRQCVGGRLLLGNPAYRNSGQFMESFFVFGDYLYQFVDCLYGHVGVKNRRAIYLNKMLGYHPNEGTIEYPEELYVKGDHSRPQTEYMRTREEYEQMKARLLPTLSAILYED